MRRFTRILWTGAAPALLGGCLLDIDFKGTSFLCESEPSCPAGYTCVDGRCVEGSGSGEDGGTDQGDGGAPVADLAFRRQLTFDNAERAALADFPVMVRLDATRIEYDAVRADGGDIQFRDADGSTLPHEIESWSPGATSVLWVRVPAIDEKSAADHIFMYYGNPDVTVAENSAGVWGSYRAVYHLEPEEPGAAPDSTAQGFDGTTVGATRAEGRIAGAFQFNGTDQYIDLGTDRSFVSGVAGATAEAWLAPGTLATPGIALGISINGADVSRLQFRVLADGVVVNAGARTQDGGDLLALDGGAIPTEEWTWVVAVFDFAGDAITVYQNGVESATTAGLGFADATPDTTSNISVIGVDENKTANFWLGRIDEVRVATSTLGPDWVSAQFASMNDALISYGAVEAQ